jgi:hypothetical protein
MGGIGSGVRGSKEVVERCYILDIFRLVRDGHLKARLDGSGLYADGGLIPIYNSEGEEADFAIGQVQAAKDVPEWYWEELEILEAIGFTAGLAQAGLDKIRLYHMWQGMDIGRGWWECFLSLTATSPNYGWLRWWFLCPAWKNWGPCRRRVGKLYRPEFASYYACRHCHVLTYRSCQMSHRRDPAVALLERDGWPMGELLDVFGPGCTCARCRRR